MLDKEMVAVFHGRVQGVGFRAAIQSQAARLGLKGFVSNLANGTVELHAQGSQEKLDQLLQMIKKRFHIEHVEVSFRPISKPLEDFKILRP